MSGAAPWPALSVEPGVLAASPWPWHTTAVLTTPSAWRLAGPMLPRAPGRVCFVTGADRVALDALCTAAKDYPMVAGLGGGLALDAAKYVAKRNQADLVQVPSTVANNACFTRTCWVLDGGVRRAERDAPVPRAILADPVLIGRAPARLNRAGVAEILCSHTALVDWRLGRDAGRPVDWDDALLALAERELAALDTLAPAIGRDEPSAAMALLLAGERFAPGFVSHPKARFNSGSEHLFGWALDARGGTPMLHGETVSLGILLMTHVQGRLLDWPLSVIRAAGVGYRPDDLGIGWDDVLGTLLHLPETALAMPWYTVLDAWREKGEAAWQARARSAVAAVRGLG